MTKTEATFFWIAVTFFIISTLLYWLEIVFKRDLKRLNYVAVGSGFISLSLAIIYRWAITRHPPALGVYENTLATAWFVVFLFIILQWRYDKVRASGGLVLPFIVLTLGYGIMSDPKLESLTTAYNGYWVWVHILFSWLAYSSYVIAGIASGIFLWKDRSGREGRTLEREALDLTRFDLVSLRYIIFGFIAQTIMIISGSIWVNRMWGSFWDWADVEIYSLISWIFYGLYLHLRYSFNWRGRKAAWMALAALGVVLISFWGTSHLMGKGGIVMKWPQN